MNEFRPCYTLIPIEYAQRMKEILLREQLPKIIDITVGPVNFKASQLSDTFESDFAGMGSIIFINSSDDDVLDYNGRKYPFFMLLGDWGYEYRFPGYHVCLGTPKYHSYFSQMDISQCLMDENSVYFVKNITKLAGPGAISRLNSGLGNDRRSKILRRDKLVKYLQAKVIDYDNQQWLCFADFPIAYLNDDKSAPELLYKYLSGFIRYSLSIEYIITQPVENGL